MSEKSKSIWKRPLHLPQLLLAWLGLLAATFLILLVIALTGNSPIGKTNEMWVLLLVGALGATILLAGWIFVRWVCCWRNFRIFLFLCICIAALIALFYAVEDWRGWHAWNQFEKKWEAKGERFDHASIVPPAVPAEQNFALSPIVATTYEQLMDKSGHEVIPRATNIINRLDFYLGDYEKTSTASGSWSQSTFTDLKPLQEYYRTLALTTNLFPSSAQIQTPAADVLLALSKYDSTIEELRAAAWLPASRFPLNYEKDCPAAILLPHLAALKNAAQLLKVRAIAELQNGESQKALDDVRLMLRLADALRSEPFLISQLVRIAIFQLAMQPVYEGLGEHRWTDEQLADVDAMLAPENFLADYRTALRGEMILLQIGCIQYLRRHPQAMFEIGFMGDPTPQGPGFLTSLIPSGWFYQNQYRCVRMTVEFFLPAVNIEQRVVSPEFVRDADRKLIAETRATTPYNMLEKMLLPAPSGAVQKFAYAASAVNLARTAIPLERYHLVHGAYPETLDGLAPQFVKTVPLDVIGGKPLKYQRAADGRFILYSVGWNESDDGGLVVLGKGKTPAVEIRKGDWAWKYPDR